MWPCGRVLMLIASRAGGRLRERLVGNSISLHDYRTNRCDTDCFEVDSDTLARLELNARCLKCGFSLYRSRPRWYDLPFALLMLKPVRCENCARRSYIRAMFGPPPRDSDSSRRAA